MPRQGDRLVLGAAMCCVSGCPIARPLPLRGPPGASSAAVSMLRWGPVHLSYTGVQHVGGFVGLK